MVERTPARTAERVPGAGVGDGRRAQYGVVFGEPPPQEPRPPPVRPKPTRLGSPGERRTPRPAVRAHGTYAKAVVEGCTCGECRGAKAAYRRRRAQAIARPEETWLPYVDAAPARAHLVALGQAGVGLKSVARLAGVSHGSLSKILYGEPRHGRAPSRRIRPDTLAKVLAVTVSGARGGQKVSAAPTWRLLDELLAAGYTRRYLARALGSQAAVPALKVGTTLVRASTARAVEDLHRQLINRRSPARGSRAR